MDNYTCPSNIGPWLKQGLVHDVLKKTEIKDTIMHSVVSTIRRFSDGRWNRPMHGTLWHRTLESFSKKTKSMLNNLPFLKIPINLDIYPKSTGYGYRWWQARVTFYQGLSYLLSVTCISYVTFNFKTTMNNLSHNSPAQKYNALIKPK